MRVGVVCPYDLGAFGGVQDQCFKLAGWLMDAGHEAVVVGPGDAPDGAISLGPVRVLTANGAATPIALRRGVGRDLAAAVDGVDVVHIHEPLMPAVSLAATRLEGVPLVGTFHADPEPMVRRLYRFGALPLRRVLRRLDVATAVSPVAAQAVRRMIDPRVIPNGLETDAFATGPKRSLSVGFIGRDDPRKGLDVLLDAWPAVHAAVPEARLRIVSDAERSPTPGVEFLGAVDDAEKREFLGETAVLCAPNLSGESFGIVLVEGMASRCAVVASTLPAFVNVLEDQGMLVPPGDSVGLSQMLTRLLSDPDRIEQLGRGARARSHRFDRGPVLEGYLGAYQDAVAVHGSRSVGPAAEG